MKLSTRIERSGFLRLCRDGDTSADKIVLLVDCGKEREETYSLFSADLRHKEFLKKGYTLLPKESPVYNGEEIIFHYTSTTYKEWCES